jgi:dolichyl-phosphate-mannose--protein O-mannosyl transferase
VNLFLILAVISSAIAFIMEVTSTKEFLWKVVAWLILTLVFYLLSLLVPVTIGRKSSSTT